MATFHLIISPFIISIFAAILSVPAAVVVYGNQSVEHPVDGYIGVLFAVALLELSVHIVQKELNRAVTPREWWIALAVASNSMVYAALTSTVAMQTLVAIVVVLLCVLIENAEDRSDYRKRDTAVDWALLKGVAPAEMESKVAELQKGYDPLVGIRDLFESFNFTSDKPVISNLLLMLARFVTFLIPPACPAEGKVVFGKTLPKLCRINPIYQSLTVMQMNAQSSLDNRR